MIELHQYPAAWGLPSLSPFCIKVETYLKLSDLPYTIFIENNPKKGPKGKMPFIVDKNNIIADSTFIIRYLKSTYGDPLDSALSEKQKALSLCIQKVFEECLYFVILYSRWIDPSAKKIIDTHFKQFFPLGLGKLALAIIRRSLKKQGYAQGIARHSRDEIYYLAIEDMKAVLSLWEGDHYFLDGKIHTIDIVIYSFVSLVIKTPVENPLKDFFLSSRQFSQHYEIMESRILPN